jgi:hypothetical protein
LRSLRSCRYKEETFYEVPVAGIGKAMDAVDAGL